MKDLAPVILFVYNRPWHTRQTLEALKANDLAKDSVLYIFSDGPKKNANQEDLKKIQEVRKLIRDEYWCGEVKIIEREQNLGLSESVISGVTEIINIHERVIVLEDDLVTGKFFLKFMNDALEIYKSETKVFGVSGYKYPSEKKILDSTYFLPIASSWSYATWKDRWMKVNFNSTELIKMVEAGDFQKELDFGGNAFYAMLEDQIQGRNDSWAIRFYVSMFLERAYFLYPSVSLVTNIGFDNSGTHCSKDDYFSKVLAVNKYVEVKKIPVVMDNDIIKNFSETFLRRVKNGNYKIFFKKVVLRFSKLKR